MTTVLQVHQAFKKFGPTQALNGADLSLAQGELLALLGPNGAGKTTLVRAVAGRVRLDAGSITLFGESLTATAGTARRRLGIVPQEIALYPLLNPRENLEIFGSLQGIAGGELAERVKWALEWTGLAERERDLVNGFSGGMKRRLNIACGVLHKPEVLLLDEPTVGVDPQSRERIWEMLDRLKQQGMSLVLTTHQLDEAQTRCDRIVIIDHGKTIADGTFAQLVDKTVGSQREVRLTLDRPFEVGLPGVAQKRGRDPSDGAVERSETAAGVPSPFLGVETKLEGRTLSTHVRDVAAELPPLIERVRQAGRQVEDIAINSPSLQTVFLHLTGRELRE
jgi:ABC-2 type transport system ATP-binding protein